MCQDKFLPAKQIVNITGAVADTSRELNSRATVFFQYEWVGFDWYMGCESDCNPELWEEHFQFLYPNLDGQPRPWQYLLSVAGVGWIFEHYFSSQGSSGDFLEGFSEDYERISAGRQERYTSLATHREAGTSPSSRIMVYLYLEAISHQLVTGLEANFCQGKKCPGLGHPLRAMLEADIFHRLMEGLHCARNKIISDFENGKMTPAFSENGKNLFGVSRPEPAGEEEEPAGWEVPTEMIFYVPVYSVRLQIVDALKELDLKWLYDRASQCSLDCSLSFRTEHLDFSWPDSSGQLRPWYDILAEVVVGLLSSHYDDRDHLDCSLLEGFSITYERILRGHQQPYTSLAAHRKAGTSPSPRELLYLYLVEISDHLAVLVRNHFCRGECFGVGGADLVVLRQDFFNSLLLCLGRLDRKFISDFEASYSESQ